jgi:PAS domain S-box-containing protein
MNKQTKTNAELIEEISSLKQRIQELEQSESERKRTEDKLRESEAQYRLLADNMRDQVWLMDLNLKPTYISPSVAKSRGYTFEEIAQLPLDKHLTATSYQSAMEFFSIEMPKALANPAYFTMRSLELEFYRKDGSTYWVENAFSLIWDENGKPMSLLGVGRDITERKRAEEELRESEEKYRNILENIEDGYFEVDRAGDFTFFNPSLCRILGYPREEMSGMNYRVLTDAENVKIVFQAFNEIYVTGIPAKGFEWEVIQKSGARRHLDVSVSLIVNPGEKPTRFRGIARDITERKRAEEELQDTLESLRKAVGATIQVMVSAVETRDPYTAGHQIRSADLARAIATEMGLPHEKIEGIRVAGSIHDIGKLSIPAEILSKPTKLTNIEFSLIKEHARKGYEMLKDVESPWPLAEMVYQHHERMDGSGYPQHLKGDDILMEARILAVADVVEAMASHRPYRPALGIDKALDEIDKNRGTVYDNTVANACLRLFREKGYQIERT